MYARYQDSGGGNGKVMVIDTEGGRHARDMRVPCGNVQL
jgi:hypothetical protein